MLTWKQFFEKVEKDIEKEEEKLGKDLDGDKEEGESAAHKKKVFGCKKCGKIDCKCGCGHPKKMKGCAKCGKD